MRLPAHVVDDGPASGTGVKLAGWFSKTDRMNAWGGSSPAPSVVDWVDNVLTGAGGARGVRRCGPPPPPGWRGQHRSPWVAGAPVPLAPACPRRSRFRTSQAGRHRCLRLLPHEMRLDTRSVCSLAHPALQHLCWGALVQEHLQRRARSPTNHPELEADTTWRRGDVTRGCGHDLAARPPGGRDNGVGAPDRTSLATPQPLWG